MDYQDPRKGVRYAISRWWTDEESAGASEYYQQEHNLTAYIPIGRISTWAFNYFRSDAFVTRTGDTDFASVENRLGLTCSTPACQHNNVLCVNKWLTIRLPITVMVLRQVWAVFHVFVPTPKVVIQAHMRYFMGQSFVGT